MKDRILLEKKIWTHQSAIAPTKPLDLSIDPPPPPLDTLAFETTDEDPESIIGARIFEPTPYELVRYTIPVPVLGFGRRMPAMLPLGITGEVGAEEVPGLIRDGRCLCSDENEAVGARSECKLARGELTVGDGTGTAGRSPATRVV